MSIEIKSNGGTGAMLLRKDPITGNNVIPLGLNNEDEVRELQMLLNKFVEEQYDKYDEWVESFEYLIPINGDEERVKTINAGLGTDIKSTEWHIENMFNKLDDTIEKVGNEGGWYISDDIRVKVQVTYEPENK